MPCRVDVCSVCHHYDCRCHEPFFKKWQGFDHEGALCDALNIIESAGLLKSVDAEVREWWSDHEEREKDRIKAEALAKLSPRERRALGLK